MTIQANLHGRIGTIENKTWNNKQYTTVSVAINKGPNKPAQWVEATVWAQEQQDKIKDCGKGDHILVQGNLTLDEFVSKKTNEKKIAIKVKAQNICLIKKKNGTEQAATENTEKSNYY